MANSSLAKHLKVKTGDALLSLTQISFLQDGQAFEYVRSYYVGDRFEFLFGEQLEVTAFFCIRIVLTPWFYGKMELMEIEKTNRMNALFEFYAALLTDKQMNYIELYYADDYSLAEIAEEFGVSRQAVYDNIKRTEKILEAYEMKLHMYSDYIVRSQIFDDIMENNPDR